MTTRCDRCGQTRERTYTLNGVSGNYGSECVKIVARENGIIWTGKFGPGAFDVEAMRRAMELQRCDSGRFVYGREERDAQKFLVGSVAWRIAEGVANHRVMRLNGDEAYRCYRVAIEARAAQPQAPTRGHPNAASGGGKPASNAEPEITNSPQGQHRRKSNDLHAHKHSELGRIGQRRGS